MTSRCHVLVISQHLYPTHPTLRRNVLHLLEQGMRVDLICLRPPREAARAGLRPGLRVYGLPLRHRRRRGAYPLEYATFALVALTITYLLNLRGRYEAVQVDNLPDFLVFTAAPAQAKGARLVLYMHELMPELAAARLACATSHPIVRLIRGLERLATQRADDVIVVNEPCRRILQRRGTAAEKITVLPNTQPAHAIRAHPQDTRLELVTHGTLVERYGVQTAIAALSQLREQWPELRLRVIGEGEYLPQLMKLAAERDLADRVVFRPYLPWAEAMAEIRTAAVGLVPVLAGGYGEVMLPQKLFDYISAGVPAVCSRLPAIVECFPDGAVAYYSPGDAAGLADQVHHLLCSPDKAQQQVRAADAALRKLSWETASTRYVEALLGRDNGEATSACGRITGAGEQGSEVASNLAVAADGPAVFVEPDQGMNQRVGARLDIRA